MGAFSKRETHRETQRETEKETGKETERERRGGEARETERVGGGEGGGKKVSVIVRTNSTLHHHQSPSSSCFETFPLCSVRFQPFATSFESSGSLLVSVPSTTEGLHPEHLLALKTSCVRRAE